MIEKCCLSFTFSKGVSWMLIGNSFFLNCCKIAFSHADTENLTTCYLRVMPRTFKSAYSHSPTVKIVLSFMVAQISQLSMSSFGTCRY